MENSSHFECVHYNDSLLFVAAASSARQSLVGHGNSFLSNIVPVK